MCIDKLGRKKLKKIESEDPKFPKSCLRMRIAQFFLKDKILKKWTRKNKKLCFEKLE